MIVYAETNFLLEIAYLQEGFESCREILNLARDGNVTLVVPAFSLIEARQTWDRRSSEHNALRTQLQPIIRQLARSEPFRTVDESSRDLLAALWASGENARHRLEDTIVAMSSVASVLPLTAEVASRARHEELRLDLSPSDALVYTSVVTHLEHAPQGKKCFANRDLKGFASPRVDNELARYDCKLISDFSDALKFIRSRSRSAIT